MVSVLNFVYETDMAGPDDSDIPESGAVFTFGRSRFADNQPSHFFIRNDSVVEISCGDEHTALVCENGRIFVFGSNDYGQLGLGHVKAVLKPSCVKLLKPFHAVLVACGKAHTLVYTACGQLFAFGLNADGQLGLGDLVDRTTPTAVELDSLGISKITALDAGCFHSALLTDGGEAYTWGCNSDGQCGFNKDDTMRIQIPTKVRLNAPIHSISCGYYHTLLACNEGVYSMGEAENWKLGRAEGESQCIPLKVNLDVTARKVFCGGSHSVVLTENGEVYGFGSNFSGQLGRGSNPVVQTPTKINLEKPVVNVACGESHTAFVSGEGDLYTCGDTRHGKLCLEDFEGTSLATPTLVTVLQPYTVIKVSCGGCHTMVVAKLRTDTSDADIIQGKTMSLPPLKVRKPAENDTDNLDEAITEIMTEIEGGGDHEGVEVSSVVMKSEKPDEQMDARSNTESSINLEEAVTSPADDVYSQTRELSSDIEEMDSPKRELHSSDSAGDVVVKPASRLQKFLSVFKKKKTTSSPLQSPTSDADAEVFLKDGEKIGNHQSSKACTIL